MPEGLEYVPFYCEENVWRLLSRPELAGLETWAVAVFSPGTSVPVRRQRHGQGPEGLIQWDYHVFALAKGDEGFRVLDFDTTLGFSTPARDYLEAVFREGHADHAGPAAGASAAQPVGDGDRRRGRILFRVMEGREYCRRLASDRSHMRGPDGDWLEPPPDWPAPRGCGEGSWPLADMIVPSEGGPGPRPRLAGLESFVAAAWAAPGAAAPEAAGTEGAGPGSAAVSPAAAGNAPAPAREASTRSKREGGTDHHRLRLMALRRIARALLVYFICMYAMTLVLDTSLQATMEAQILEGVNSYMASGAARGMPGTPAEIKKGMIESLRRGAGLDQPVALRALARTWRVVTFQLGKEGDLMRRSSAASEVVEALGNTLILFGISTVMALGLGILLGAQMARRPGSLLDRGVSFATMLFFGTPAWWIGSILIMLFVFRFPVFNFGAVSSVPAPEGLLARLLDRASYLVLPVLSIAFIRTWGIAYMTRSIILPQLHEDYVMAARGRGIREGRVLRGHVMGTAMPGIATSATQYLVAILGGDIVVETVFAYRGIGYLFWYSLRFNHTVTAVLSLAVLVAMTCLAYAVLDVAYSYLDPRIRRPDRRKSPRG